jgi:hypothetical protein
MRSLRWATQKYIWVRAHQKKYFAAGGPSIMLYHTLHRGLMLTDWGGEIKKLRAIRRIKLLVFSNPRVHLTSIIPAHRQHLAIETYQITRALRHQGFTALYGIFRPTNESRKAVEFRRPEVGFFEVFSEGVIENTDKPRFLTWT